jgi:phosphoribosylanthranilate isomerase
MKVKICGMKYRENTAAVAALAPDYMGFIFYERSPRFMGRTLAPEDLARLPAAIVRTGVFVNEDYETILNTVLEYDLDAVQLHGDEKPAFVARIKSSLPADTGLIKAFGIDSRFDWSALNHYQDYCDLFLFDTKTSNYGGSGSRFDHTLLSAYDLDVPVMIAGGIGPEELEELTIPEGVNVVAVDMNSKLEIEAGRKDIDRVRLAISRVRAL